MNPNYIACYALIGRLKEYGVTHCVMSPGSRSTPLAFVANELLDTTVVIDERSAGFVALGISESTKMPCVVITTSGSAPTHLYPSVVEAHHSNVGMIIISADRPHEIRGIGAPQTIDQHNLYGSASNFFLDVICPHDQPDTAYWEQIADDTYSSADFAAVRPGVAHINMGMREPLVPQGGEYEKYLKEKSDIKILPNFDNTETQEIKFDIDSFEKILITVGRNAHVASWAISRFAEQIQAPVLVDSISNFRNVESFIPNYDAIARIKNSDDIYPDLIIQFGEPLTSKVFNLKMKDIHTIAFKRFDDKRNPWTNQDENIICADIDSFLSKYLRAKALKRSDEFKLKWIDESARVQSTVEKLIKSQPESEPSIFYEIGQGIKAISQRSSILVASSMPVRYAEWFWDEIPANIDVYSHRGTNGIDGMLASTLGIAKGTNNPVMTILGDVAFSHDVGSLPTLNSQSFRLGLHTKLIVINNHGGAIFNHLEQAKSDLFASNYEKIMATPPDLNIEGLCQGMGIKYSKLKTSEVKSNIHKLIQDFESGLSIVEIELEYDSGRYFMEALEEAL